MSGKCFSAPVVLIAKSTVAGLGGIVSLFIILLMVPSTGCVHADEFQFASLVQFKLVSTFGAGEVGSLSTTFGPKEIDMRLSNVAAAGADKSQELVTKVDRADLSLISSTIYDLQKGKAIRRMDRKVGTSMLDNSKAEIFEFREFREGGRVTSTEPYVEFKVVDFISVILIAVDAINRNDKKPANLSMLRDRSVVRVTMKFVGEETIDGRPGTIVKVAPPDNPTGGISYTIARSTDGVYYPARISVETSRGLVQLDGTPQQ